MTLPLRFPLLFACFAVTMFAAETPAPTWPLWDGHESIEQYAKRTNLPPTKTLDLGNGVNLELVLIPAGKFVMGTPEPVPVDEDGFRNSIITGEATFAAAIGVLLVLIGTIIIRAVRERHRPQYSLVRFTAMTAVAGIAVMGGMHWSYSTKARVRAWAEYAAAVGRYRQADDNEKPAHEVTLTTPFYIGKLEVTQEQYERVRGTNPSNLKGPTMPVENVLWDDTKAFCRKASERTGGVVRLPTEAEWEYSCRAGTTTTYYTGDAETDLDRAAWYLPNSKDTTHPVGTKAPNAWGIYDMCGNVWEWCSDWYGRYNPNGVVDPRGPSGGDCGVARGGSWGDDAGACRPSARRWMPGRGRDGYLGFRIVVEVPKTP
jgi:formylglycine-generating enzyme required for sulfatase activity